jgi:epoxyqueuosine reductase
MLRKLADFITRRVDETAQFKICVDSVPLAERALAVEAGLGFIGKNHMLINPEFGPEVFLGELITTIELERDKPMETNCKDCDKCIRSCPSRALKSDGSFDASRCISYLTIEHKGEIPEHLKASLGRHIFGCDECVLACPYQHKAPTRDNQNIKHYPNREFLSLHKILNMSQLDFNNEYADSPLKHCGLEKIQRNAKICKRK